MPVFINGNVNARLSLYWQLGDQVGQIDHNISARDVSVGALWSSADLFNQLTITTAYDLAKAMVSNNATLLGAKLYYKLAGAPPLVDQDTSPNGAGTGGAGNLPTQVSGLISWQSVVGGRQGKGRSYVPFPWTAALGATGVPIVAYQTALADYAGVMQPGFIVPNVGSGGGTLNLKLCTHYTVGIPTRPFPFDTFSVPPAFATQRRRGFFGRQNRAPI